MTCDLSTLKARVVVPEDAPREVWMEERGEGVTASEALDVARATVKARKRILEAKMNGSTFRGNKATKAGHAREAALLDEAGDHLQVVIPNSALWGAVGNDLHRATPDGIGFDAFGNVVVIEVKSHDCKWNKTTIPIEHYAQMQFQIYVIGADYALYGFEVRDEHDMPPLEGATWKTVPRDDEMIDWLVQRADDFIAWREAGCPDEWHIPEETLEALTEWLELKRNLDLAAADEKAASDALKLAIKNDYPHAARFGANAVTPEGGFQLVVSERFSIDEKAWQAGDPTMHAKAESLRADLARLEAAAIENYKTVKRIPSLRLQEVEQ